MPKKYTGVSYRKKAKKWEARFVFRDETGKRFSPTRRADSHARAKELYDELKKTYQHGGARVMVNRIKTFGDLADYYQEHYLKAAEYHAESGRKIAGLRSWKTPVGQLSRMRGYFGKKQLHAFTYATIHAYKADRLSTKSDRTNRQLSIASINRELALLRRMFNIARREGWINTNPFNAGEGLISSADEQKRERILTQEEEARLLEACSRPSRGHLRPLIIAALDTGMRQGELLSLKWADVDLVAGIIQIRSTNTKTAVARAVPVTRRLRSELRKLLTAMSQLGIATDEHAVFTCHIDGERAGSRMGGVKSSFNSARADAQLPALRFHDLRHTAATRMVRQGMALSEIGKILGHTEPATTYRYINTDADTLRRAAFALDTYSDTFAETSPQDSETDRAPDIVH